MINDKWERCSCRHCFAAAPGDLRMRLRVDVRQELSRWSYLIGFYDDATTLQTAGKGVVNTVQHYRCNTATDAQSAIYGIVRNGPKQPKALDSTVQASQLSQSFTHYLQRQRDATKATYTDVMDGKLLEVVRDAEWRCEMIWVTMAEWLTRRTLNA